MAPYLQFRRQQMLGAVLQVRTTRAGRASGPQVRLRIEQHEPPVARFGRQWNVRDGRLSEQVQFFGRAGPDQAFAIDEDVGHQPVEFVDARRKFDDALPDQRHALLNSRNPDAAIRRFPHTTRGGLVNRDLGKTRDDRRRRSLAQLQNARPRGHEDAPCPRRCDAVRGTKRADAVYPVGVEVKDVAPVCGPDRSFCILGRREVLRRAGTSEHGATGAVGIEVANRFAENPDPPLTIGKQRVRSERLRQRLRHHHESRIGRAPDQLLAAHGPEATVDCRRLALNGFGARCRWPHEPQPVESQQAVVREDPQITFRRLQSSVDPAHGRAVVLVIDRVHVGAQPQRLRVRLRGRAQREAGKHQRHGELCENLPRLPHADCSMNDPRSGLAS